MWGNNSQCGETIHNVGEDNSQCGGTIHNVGEHNEPQTCSNACGCEPKIYIYIFLVCDKIFFFSLRSKSWTSEFRFWQNRIKNAVMNSEPKWNRSETI